MKNNKFEIKEKKNKINEWLEIKCADAPNEHIKNMLEAMKKNRTIYFIEDDKSYIFNTVALSKIKEYLTLNSDIKNIIRIFKEAISLQEKSINYLIPTECIIFDANYTYIDKKSGKLELIILPIDNRKNIYDFHEWIAAILKYVNKNNNKNINEFINQVLQQINKSSFCLNSFKDFLEREENKINKRESMSKAFDVVAENNIESNTNIKSNDKNFENIKGQEYIKKENSNNIFINSFYAEDTPFLRKTNQEFWSENNNRVIHLDRITEEKDNRPKNKNKDIQLFRNSKIEKLKSYLPMAIFQILMMIVLAICCYYSIHKFINPKKAIAGVSIIWLVINYFISKEILIFQKQRQNSQLDKLKENKNMLKSRLEKKVIDKKKFSELNKAAYENTNLLKYKEDDLLEETELLYKKTNKQLYLKNYENQNVLTLNKKINIVGRKYNEVDLYIDDTSIGRVHAAIILEDNKIFLQDNNSLNGCYVNDIRLDKNDKMQIEVGDEISFSRCNYTLVYDAA